MDSVVVIYCSPDGDLPTIRQMKKTDFLDRLHSDYKDGDAPRFAEMKDGDELDTAYFDGYVVIEGRVIQPKAVAVERKWTL